MTHSTLSVIQRFIQQCFDGYIVKYTARIIGLGIFSILLYCTAVDERGTTNEIAGRYVNVMRLMMQSSSPMGQLVLVYKRMNTIASGHTARVTLRSELIDKVKQIGKARGHLEAIRRVQGRIGTADCGGTVDTAYLQVINDTVAEFTPNRFNAPTSTLQKVTTWSPDSSPLVHNLSFEVTEGTSVIIVDPGQRKEQRSPHPSRPWPSQAGSVGLPVRGEIFYLSQQPQL